MKFTKKLYQVYYWIPLNKNPVWWFVSWVVFFISIAISVAIFESSFRSIPLENELKITKGILLDVRKGARGGIYLVVSDDLSGKALFFPKEGGRFPISQFRRNALENKVGEKIIIKWSKPWIFLNRKKPWEVIIGNDYYKRYKKSAQALNKYRDVYRKIFIISSGLCIFLIFIYWFIYCKELIDKE